MYIGVGRDRKTKALVGERVLCVSSINLVSREAGTVAQVFAPRAAVRAYSARETEPGDADPVAGAKTIDVVSDFRHDADDLMAGNQGKLGLGQLAVNHVEIRPADAAGVHANQHLIGSRSRHREIDGFQRGSCGVQNHSVHVDVYLIPLTSDVTVSK